MTFGTKNESFLHVIITYLGSLNWNHLSTSKDIFTLIDFWLFIIKVCCAAASESFILNFWLILFFKASQVILWLFGDEHSIYIGRVSDCHQKATLLNCWYHWWGFYFRQYMVFLSWHTKPSLVVMKLVGCRSPWNHRGEKQFYIDLLQLQVLLCCNCK